MCAIAGVDVGGKPALDWGFSITSALVLATTGTLEPCRIEDSRGELHAARFNRATMINTNEMDLLNGQTQK